MARYDVSFSSTGVSLDYHYCPTSCQEAAKTRVPFATFGRCDIHGLTFKMAKAEIISYLTGEIIRWGKMTEKEWEDENSS